MIDPVSGAAVAGTIAEINNGLAGMSLADAYDAYMDSSYDDASGVSIGVGNWTSNKPAITGDASNSIYDSSEATAQEAWLDWMHNNPDLVDQTTGGASLGSDAKAINYSLIEKTVELSPVVQAVQPIAVPLEIAVLGLSQALGVSMDLTAMETETKRAISDSFLEFGGMMYDKARNLALAWWDGVSVLFPKKSLKAMEDGLNDLAIGGTSGEGTASGTPPASVSPVTMPFNYTVGSRFEVQGQSNYGYAVFRASNDVNVAIFTGSNGNGTRFIVASVSPFTYGVATYRGPNQNPPLSSQGAKITVAGVEFYYAAIESSNGSVINCPYPIIYSGYIDFNTQKNIGAAMIANGHVGSYPEGTAESEAQKYTSGTIPIAGKIAGAAGAVHDAVVVNVPSGTSTIDSTLDPNSETDPNREEELPEAPIPVPIPDTRPSNPGIELTNPSQVGEETAEKIDELVGDLANTVDPQPPQSTGLAPLPYMPGTPVIDPETGEPTGETVYPSIVPSSGSGLIHVYNPTPAEFMAFGQWLWVTYADATIDKIWNNPFDGIIGAFELYSTPSVDGRDNIRSGFLVCPTSANLVRQRYTEINCGTVVVPEFYGNYLDYSPYSQCYIYLPFIGINEVSIDDIVGHAVNIRYRVDAYNGSCIAMIYVAKDGYENLCYQFAGNCGVEVPLAGGSQAAIKAGMMQAEAYGRAAVQSAQIQKTASIGTGIVNGASAGAGAGAMNPVAGIVGGLLGALAGGTSGYIQGSADYGAAKLSAGAMQEAARVANKSSVQHSGSFGSSHGAMGNKIPFMIIRTPIQVKVVNYNDDYGFPAHKRVIIGGCTGYLRVREVNVISAFATNEEKIAIEQALKEGVYVT